jgi:protein SCO1/2
LTPTGIISRYLYGIQFEPKTVRLSLVEASQGKLGTVIDKLVLTCFQYNPDKRGYAFYAYNIVRYGAGIMVIALFALLVPIWRRERSRSLSGGVAS